MNGSPVWFPSVKEVALYRMCCNFGEWLGLVASNTGFVLGVMAFQRREKLDLNGSKRDRLV